MENFSTVVLAAYQVTKLPRTSVMLFSILLGNQLNLNILEQQSQPTVDEL